METRKLMRLKKYDYSEPGSYFVTVCVQGRKNIFGKVVNQHMIIGDAGRMIQSVWNELPVRFTNIELDESVVMPNHFHGIIVIKTVKASTVGAGFPRPLSNGLRKTLLSGDSLISKGAVKTLIVGAPLVGARDNGSVSDFVCLRDNKRAGTRPAPTIGDIVGAFKSLTTCEYIRGVRQFGWFKFKKSLWQRNYYEHVVRDEMELCEMRRYIQENPAKWDLDPENSSASTLIRQDASPRLRLPSASRRLPPVSSSGVAS